jgi:hypothetical protein
MALLPRWPQRIGGLTGVGRRGADVVAEGRVGVHRAQGIQPRRLPVHQQPVGGEQPQVRLVPALQPAGDGPLRSVISSERP